MAETLNLNMSGAVLRVDPQVMYEKSNEAGLLLDEMRRAYENMNAAVKRSQNYWLGEAGDLHRATYQKRQEEAEKIFQRLQEHVDELKQMGRIYEGAEQQSLIAAEDLSSDVIV